MGGKMILSLLLLLIPLQGRAWLQTIRPKRTYCTESIGAIRPAQGLETGMKMNKISKTELLVSSVGLGTSTFGEQVNEASATTLLDAAVKQYGINFIDCSELYPIPYGSADYGESDRIVGRWLASQPKTAREGLVISACVAGYSDFIDWARPAGKLTRGSREQIIEAVDAYLRRLQVDYIDLLQLQWPERYVPESGSLYEPSKEWNQVASIEEQLRTMAELIAQGKIRHYGLSNETPFGVGVVTTLARQLHLPEPVSLQKPYNLLERREVEASLLESIAPSNGNLALFAYSPLAGGALTGKYRGSLGDVDRAARMRKYIGFMSKYLSPSSRAAVDRYQVVAEEWDLPLHALSLAWLFSQPHVTSVLLGVTSMEQLEQNVQASQVAPVAESLLAAIDSAHLLDREPTNGAPYELEDPDTVYDDIFPINTREMEMDHRLEEMLQSS